MKAKAILTLLFTLFTVAGTAIGQSVVDTARGVSGDNFRYTSRTPKGAMVYGVSRPSASALNAIDRGLTDLFAVARKNGYSRKTSYADYTIFIARADRTTNNDGNYSPDIAVGAAQYAGSVYDQGGFIYAAGMVISNTPCAFVIAEHTKEFNRMQDVVRYEGEHLILFHNDRRRYRATMDHSQGGGHPILQ